MKKNIVLLISVLLVSTIYSNKLEKTSIDSVLNENTSKYNQGDVVYRLYPTENMWTFIKLNTRNGQMWQVQFDVNGEDRFESYLNVIPLVSKEMEVNGRFTLQSTQNIYTFILLDQLDGQTWQVQWSIEYKKRLIFPIK